MFKCLDIYVYINIFFYVFGNKATVDIIGWLNNHTVHHNYLFIVPFDFVQSLDGQVIVFTVCRNAKFAYKKSHVLRIVKYKCCARDDTLSPKELISLYLLSMLQRVRLLSLKNHFRK